MGKLKPKSLPVVNMKPEKALRTMSDLEVAGFHVTELYQMVRL
jgi:hypothetical protein